MSETDDVSLELNSQEIALLAERADVDKLKVTRTPGGTVVTLPATYADELRDLFADELIRQELDEQYRPTAKGRILESLIDKMHF